jgi:NAD(P)H dehydrogenase (quinone)
MRTISHLVILGHPSPDSFNSAVAGRYVEAVRANHQDAILRDLYALDFDPATERIGAPAYRRRCIGAGRTN